MCEVEFATRVCVPPLLKLLFVSLDRFGKHSADIVSLVKDNVFEHHDRGGCEILVWLWIMLTLLQCLFYFLKLLV